MSRQPNDEPREPEGIFGAAKVLWDLFSSFGGDDGNGDDDDDDEDEEDEDTIDTEGEDVE